ncbi:CsbD family protein [Aureimonas glaciei]|jgi:uncharacterized protein YjbJ (UPF0337 family)|uniref:CsbD-like domain-containing protein n=1 Tax=Aureimonas glaciei TaxID=1776957 RepID=A0A916Y169_9HYPH|nr:CsbD family protein [Aureimonas glaciei]GGD24887.1 hypothetical protein GCM10011335_29810 [Aureimonas glaciei]
MADHETKGTIKEVGGSIKETAGKAVGNERVEAEGAADRVEGKTEKNLGKVENAAKDAVR